MGLMYLKYFGVCILYNKNILDSITINSIKRIKPEQFTFVIIDNGSEEYISKNKLVAQKLKYKYYPMNNNLGLSVAYNRALDVLKNIDDDDIIIWLDDDTEVPDCYFDTLYLSSIESDYDAFIPVVYGRNGVIYSPNEKGLFKGHYMKNPNDKINFSKINAINSCLAVRKRFYNNYRYDENLFMDCVDTKLFDDMRKRQVKFCILPVTITQEFFQRSEDLQFDKLWSRFYIRIKDLVYYSKMNGTVSEIICSIKVILWGILYSIKFRNLSFLKKCVSRLIECRRG